MIAILCHPLFLKYHVSVLLPTFERDYRCPVCERAREKHTDSEGNEIEKGTRVLVIPANTAKSPERMRLKDDGNRASTKRARVSCDKATPDVRFNPGVVVSSGTDKTCVFCPSLARVVLVPTSSLSVDIEQQETAQADGHKNIETEHAMDSLLRVGCLVSIVCDLRLLKKKIAESKQEDMLTCNLPNDQDSISVKANPDADVDRAHSKKKKTSQLKILCKTADGLYPEIGMVVGHQGEVHYVLLRRTSRIVSCRRCCLSQVRGEYGNAFCLF